MRRRWEDEGQQPHLGSHEVMVGPPSSITRMSCPPCIDGETPLLQPKWKWASRDESGHQHDEPGLGREPRSNERLRAGQARQSHVSHDVTSELTWSCES